MKHPLETLTTAAGILLMAFLSCLLLPAPALGLTLAQNDAPRDKCAHFREINGIAAAFQHLQKNYNPIASSFL